MIDARLAPVESWFTKFTARSMVSPGTTGLIGGSVRLTDTEPPPPLVPLAVFCSASTRSAVLIDCGPGVLPVWSLAGDVVELLLAVAVNRANAPNPNMLIDAISNPLSISAIFVDDLRRG